MTTCSITSVSPKVRSTDLKRSCVNSFTCVCRRFYEQSALVEIVRQIYLNQRGIV